MAAVSIKELGFVILQPSTKRAQNFATITTGSTDQGDVLIELTPKIVDNRLEVTITANTHTADLSQFDLAKTTMLEADGKKIPPASVPALQGHHVSGTMEFEGVPAGSFSIVITGIPQVEARRYSWP